MNDDDDDDADDTVDFRTTDSVGWLNGVFGTIRCHSRTFIRAFCMFSVPHNNNNRQTGEKSFSSWFMCCSLCKVLFSWYHRHSCTRSCIESNRIAPQHCWISTNLLVSSIVQLHEFVCVQIVSLIISFISKTGGRWSNEILSCSNFAMKLFKAAHSVELTFVVHGRANTCAFWRRRNTAREWEEERFCSTIVNGRHSLHSTISLHGNASAEQHWSVDSKCIGRWIGGKAGPSSPFTNYSNARESISSFWYRSHTFHVDLTACTFSPKMNDVTQMSMLSMECGITINWTMTIPMKKWDYFGGS